MNIFRAYRKSASFLWINILGLSIGLAASILLILLIISELSYDKHFPNADRIVRVYTSCTEDNGDTEDTPKCRRSAYTEVPERVAGIKAATQIYDIGSNEIKINEKTFRSKSLFMVDKGFIEIFSLKFIEGDSGSALSDINTVILTESKAIEIFGTPEKAIGEKLSVSDMDITIAAVVEDMPYNTHFYFDILANINASGDWINDAGLEFHTFYLLEPNVSVEKIRKNIEQEYTYSLKPFSEQFNGKTTGKTDMLIDIYLKSETWTLDKQSSMSFIHTLSALSIIIMLLAVTNFINLFMAQGDIRMKEIGIRKTNGAGIIDIVKQFFSEVGVLVAISFITGLIMAICLIPYFSGIVSRDIHPEQLGGPVFIAGVLILFIITVFLSAFYPSLYLSRFNPLAILTNKIKVSKNKLNIAIVIVQSAITITLMSFLLVIDRQVNHLRNLPLGYELKDVLCVIPGNTARAQYDAIRQELLAVPEIKLVSRGQHLIGRGTSAEGIKLNREVETDFVIDACRIAPGVCEIMGFELIDGDFFKTTTPDSIKEVILNEAAVKMLGLEYPVAGKPIFINDNEQQISGVVKDFYYDNPVNNIAPLIMTKTNRNNIVYIKFNDNIPRLAAQQKVFDVFRKFDPEFVPNMIWSRDVYEQNFTVFKTYSKIITVFSFLSVLIAMMGLIGVHLYSTVRRTKEVGIRRIHGATPAIIFRVLSVNIIKWIIIAGIFAAPVIYLIATSVLKTYTNHVSFNWTMIIIPILIQCLIAIIVTSGVTIRALLRNPADVLRDNK